MDIREITARYYDLSPKFPDDIPFYEQNIPSPNSRILELGCGTGRVLVSLVEKCAYVFGVDASKAMLSLCRHKLAEKGIPPSKAGVQQGDIASMELGDRFDLIIAPFRVFQNLETDREVNGFFKTVRTHLSANGTAILNAFRPNMDPDRMRREWCTDGERFAWEVPVEGGRVTLHDRKPRMDRKRLVLYPELIYRRYRDDELIDEVVLRISMRCYYPDELQRLVVDEGFRVVNKWGGYAGEQYGAGPELIIKFARGA